MPETNSGNIKEQNALYKIQPDEYSRNKTIAFLLSTFGLSQGAQVLDVGGADSKLALFLGADFALTTHHNTHEAKPNGPSINPAPVFALPFADNHFEAVVAGNLLEQLPKGQRAKAVEEICRVSKNYVILAAPLRKEFIENVENMVSQQFMENSGTRHPGLEQHHTLGLPEAGEVETFLREKGYASMTIGEGNVVNWTLQQLTTGAKQGEKGADRFTGFNEFFNKNLYEMGNFEEPTYRTIFCISKEKTLKSNMITEGIAGMNKFMVKTFCYALKIAFTEDRKMLNFRKKQLNMLADTMLAARTKMTELREQNAEVFSLLQERQQAFNLLQAEHNGKSGRIQSLEEQQAVLATEMNNAKTLIQKQDNQLKYVATENENLRQHVESKEQNLKNKTRQLEETEEALDKLSKVLSESASALAAIQNSRGWKNILLYRKAKNTVIDKPWTAIRQLFKGPPLAPFSLEATTLPQQYKLHIAKNHLTTREMNRLLAEQKQFQYQPVISILMPVYNVAEEYLVKAIASVKEQTYARWELCICDDASNLAYIKPLLEKYAREDSRIRVVFRPKNGGIVKASNDALKLAQGAYVGLLDNDDELAPDALYEVVKNLQEKKYDLLYSDEDKLDSAGERCEPFFKPDWSPDLLFSLNYIGHFGVYRRKLLNEMNGFREGFDGAQDYDLVLRFTEKTSSIKHIPKILYHYRESSASSALNLDEQTQSVAPHIPPEQDALLSKSGSLQIAKKALSDALRRRCIEGEVTDGLWQGSYRVRRTAKSEPLVSIIIPFKDKKELLQRCFESILTKSTYKNFEILLVDNASELFETQEYLKSIAGNPRITILHYAEPFNYAAINNFAVKKSRGETLILLNDDTEIITPDWIEVMLEQAERVEVGAVGAKLLYPNNTVQHAGLLVGIGGISRHAFSRHASIGGGDHGYFGQVDVIKNYSAVSASCVMVRKSVYEDVGGLDEQNLATAFNDVDFCLRLREKGYLIVYTPYATLYHHEGATVTQSNSLKEAQFMENKYAHLLRTGDPYYNPNLTRERADFSLRTGDKI